MAQSCKGRLATLAGALLLPLALGAQTAWAADPPGADLKSLLDHARAHHPELRVMQHEADAAGERIAPAMAWADPVLRVELMNVNNYGNGSRFNVLPAKVGETRYTLMQMLPLWGRRELKRDIAESEHAATRSRSAATWSELAAQLKTAHAQHYMAAGSERFTLEIVELMTRLEQLAQARYAGGLAPSQDAIRAQLELTAMRAELIMLANDRRQARARLNMLLAREIEAPLAEPKSLRELPSVNVFDAQALALRARGANPAIAAEEARLRAATQAAELVRKERYPDIQIGITPAQMGSKLTSWSVMVELNLPLQRDRRDAMERESDQMAAAQRARVQAATNQLLGVLGENLAALDAARRTEALVTTQLLPQSRISLEAALAAYEAGKVDFATLLDAQRQIRKAQQDRLKAQVEAQMRLAEIERIVGEEL